MYETPLLKQESQILKSLVNALRAKVVFIVRLLFFFSPLDFGLINPIVLHFGALRTFCILKAFLVFFFFFEAVISVGILSHILEYFLFFYGIIL